MHLTLLLTALLSQALPPGVTLIQAGAYSGIDDQRVEICRDQKGWDLFWIAHNANTSGGTRPKAPKVNFKDEVAVAIFIGEKSTGGWGIKITSVVVQNNGDTIITYEAQAPGGFVTQSFTQPHVMVKVKRPKAT